MHRSICWKDNRLLHKHQAASPTNRVFVPWLFVMSSNRFLKAIFIKVLGIRCHLVGRLWLWLLWRVGSHLLLHPLLGYCWSQLVLLSLHKCSDFGLRETGLCLPPELGLLLCEGDARRTVPTGSSETKGNGGPKPTGAWRVAGAEDVSLHHHWLCVHRKIMQSVWPSVFSPKTKNKDTEVPFPTYLRVLSQG